LFEEAMIAGSVGADEEERWMYCSWRLVEWPAPLSPVNRRAKEPRSKFIAANHCHHRDIYPQQ